MFSSATTIERSSDIQDLCNDNETFDISKPFLVSQRLDALSYLVFESPVWSGFLPIFSKTETETGL